MKSLRVMLGWVIAVVAAVVAGSIVQTQFNLSRIDELGASVDLTTRAWATWHDLINFTPVLALLVSIAFAIAWPVAGLLKRRLHGHRTLLFTLAGGSAIWVMISVMNRALPVTAIGVTRDLAGVLALALCGAVAGWLYARTVPVVEDDQSHD